jgi:hypothetical protein
MFRIGGSANNGIMSMAAPRKNYADGTELGDAYARNIDFFQKAAGPGPSVRSDLGDLLISGGLNLLSGKGAGKGTLGALATSYSDPYQTFSKARSAEEANQRQIRLGALTQAITSTDAQRLANMKLKAEQIRADSEQKNREAVIGQNALKIELEKRENYVKNLGMGSLGYQIYDTRKNFEDQGETISSTFVKVNKNNIPFPAEVAFIPEGYVFFDTNGRAYKKTKPTTGGKDYYLILESGKPAVTDKTTEDDKKDLKLKPITLMDDRPGIQSKFFKDLFEDYGKGEPSYDPLSY